MPTVKVLLNPNPFELPSSPLTPRKSTGVGGS